MQDWLHRPIVHLETKCRSSQGQGEEERYGTLVNTRCNWFWPYRIPIFCMHDVIMWSFTPIDRPRSFFPWQQSLIRPQYLGCGPPLSFLCVPLWLFCKLVLSDCDMSLVLVRSNKTDGLAEQLMIESAASKSIKICVGLCSKFRVYKWKPSTSMSMFASLSLALRIIRHMLEQMSHAITFTASWSCWMGCSRLTQRQRLICHKNVSFSASKTCNDTSIHLPGKQSEPRCLPVDTSWRIQQHMDIIGKLCNDSCCSNAWYQPYFTTSSKRIPPSFNMVETVSIAICFDLKQSSPHGKCVEFP